MSKSKKSNLPVILLVIAVIIAAVIGGGYVYTVAKNDIDGKNQKNTEYNLIIKSTDDEYNVGQKLADAGIVVSDSLWTNWMDKHYSGFKYEGGEYKVTADMSYKDLAEKLKNPDISHRAVKVCIPEGYNCMDIAKTLEENKVCKAADFLKVCKSTDGFDYDFLKDVPDNDLIAYKLEGFLFPATYDWEENMAPKEVADDMLAAFDDRITDDMKKFCTDHNMTMYQLITLVSVVQKEALGKTSAKYITSVFMNRLDQGMKLQSDVTYFYAKKLRDSYGFSQQVYDAYYTYNCKGLPAGPIANSGSDIVESAINYPKTDYMYFFSDLQKEFHYAKTYEEFMALQKKYPWK